jgi:hydroxymethylbilane synthase
MSAVPPGERRVQARTIRIGTRGSALALAQAHEVRARLVAALGVSETAFEIVVIKTTVDVVLARPLADVGGKGLFTKEIEEALLGRAVEIRADAVKEIQPRLRQGRANGAIFRR